MSMSSRFSTSPSSTVSVRHAYSPRLSVALSFPKVSPVTRQEFKEECDINVIMRRYQSTGQLPQLNLSAPQYLAVSEGYDFRAQMCHVAEAQSMFNELPSGIRARFANDPAQFVDFCSNPANRKELAQMGLLSPEATRIALYGDEGNPPKGGDAPAPRTAPKASGSGSQMDIEDA